MAFEENSNPTNKALGTFQTDIHSHSMDCHGLSQVFQYTFSRLIQINNLKFDFILRMQLLTLASLTRLLLTWSGALQKISKAQ